MHNEVDKIKLGYKQKELNLEWEYNAKINDLEKENNHLHKVIEKFKQTIGLFIKWICKKFDMGAENNLIRDFEIENNTLLDAEEQIKNEEIEKELDIDWF